MTVKYEPKIGLAVVNNDEAIADPVPNASSKEVQKIDSRQEIHG